ncbi:MAG TPA: hypothetical protein EYG21_04500 [Nitrospinaceae bacterium]|jgi:hypothetical protein|nr:hypothetical protein [Nitrospinaceae bacterium]
MLFIIFGIVGYSHLIDQPKYEIGDCITPTDKGYSWYGQYGRVTAIGKIPDPDYQDDAYTLEFHDFLSVTKYFARNIEFGTKAVDKTLCVPE